MVFVATSTLLFCWSTLHPQLFQHVPAFWALQKEQVGLVYFSILLGTQLELPAICRSWCSHSIRDSLLHSEVCLSSACVKELITRWGSPFVPAVLVIKREPVSGRMFSWVHKTNLQNIIKCRRSPCFHLHCICFVFFSHILFLKTTSVFSWGAEMLYTATKTTKMIFDNHGLDVAWVRSVVFSIHETPLFWHCSFMSSLSDNSWLHLSDPLIMTLKRLGNLTV